MGSTILGSSYHTDVIWFYLPLPKRLCCLACKQDHTKTTVQLTIPQALTTAARDKPFGLLSFKEIHISAIHVTDLTSSPESLCLIVRRSRTPAVATSWIMTCGSRIRDRNGGSSIADSVSCWLIVIIMADPLSCWHLTMVVDHDRGGS